ncbi:MAG TPA: radical SAM protein [Vicinamibacteria bacterium]|nr:radical SAM protein [Vicinamibacteria bacterium]
MASVSTGRKDAFRVVDFEPAYHCLSRAELDGKVAAAMTELEDCRACPRNCGCNRLEDEMRACHTGRHAVVASAFPHFGEEDCLRGWRGSGTIFFSLCNLRCAFCQNWDISQRRSGEELDARGIAGLMLRLQEQGCHNVNFVTPEHVAPQLVEAVAEAIPMGLRLPIVYNTSAYDGIASLRLMDGLVDVYMPDFKFWRPETSLRLALARDYAERAREAILEMHRQVGVLRFGEDGLAKRGVLVRHLVMPGQEDEAAAIFDWLAREVSPDTYVNVMGQYRPEYKVGEIARDGRPAHVDIGRRPRPREMEAAHEAARRAGLWRFDTRRAREAAAEA